MYHKSVLKNGITVVSQPFMDRNSAAIGIWVNTGGRYEHESIKGAAHFFEHMAFKGSRKYSCSQIKEKIEGVGGALNAFTAEEQTCFYAKVPKKHFSQTFDILADIVFFPLIDKKDMEKERTVILEEIKMYHDLPQFRVMELLDGLLWPDHPLGQNLAGTPESVGGLSVADLKEFHGRHYSPGNIVVAVCGAMTHDQVEKIVGRKLAQITAQQPSSYKPALNQQSQPQVVFLRKEIEQMHVALGSLGLKTNHQDLYCLGLLNVILGGNMSSRLFNEVREKRGLAYAISSGVKAMDDTGLALIRAGVDNTKIVGAVELVLKELSKIRQNGVTADELKRAKDYFIGQFYLGLEDTMDHMLWIGETVISKDRVNKPSDVEREIRKVGLPQIKRIAQQIWDPKRLNLAVVGPLNDPLEARLRKLMKCS
ncbi:MAG: insulinase family protein [Candidatus Omnitrophica bacterium]|nr:insulinase family protein [Candidatus Omnitrophota bacterium]